LQLPLTTDDTIQMKNEAVKIKFIRLTITHGHDLSFGAEKYVEEGYHL